MRPELHAFPCVKHARITATPATVVGSVDLSLDIDRWRSVPERIGARADNVTGKLRDRSQSDGSTDADVATRAIPRGSRCQRSRRDVAHPSLVDERTELVVIAFPTTDVPLENECISIKESAG